MPNDDTEEERSFRERYAQELQKKKNQPGAGATQGDEMAQERKNVNHQQGKTPGRRGEEIKQEEIDKEIVRRNRLQQEKNRVESV
jgi:hypothetical protein